MQNNLVIEWLLGDDNPAVKYRTQTEILGQSADRNVATQWIFGKLPANWHETKGLWYTYYVTVLAECGLKADDIDASHIQRAFDTQKCECGCGDFMLLRALAKLDYADDVREVLNDVGALPDGGFLCRHRLVKMKYTPKSCYKAAIHALFCAAECRKAGIEFPNEDKLLDYFWNHKLFYRTDSPDTLILDGRPGWRVIDTFHPFEVMRVGLHNVVEAFCALGCGADERLREAWNMLVEKRGADGRYALDQTLTKSYLPKERAGKPSKWVTFYALLAQHER
jgi:hypothetical protein